MKRLSNYPPGVTGNEPQIQCDDGWEKIHDQIDEDAVKNNMSDQDVYVAWKLGLQAWLEAKKLGGKFPHDVRI